MAPDKPMSEAQAQGAMQQSRMSKKWILKLSVIALAFIAFGFWGLADAIWVYPKRGIAAAEFYELYYLRQLSTDRPPLDRRAGIDDPAARLADLKAKGDSGVTAVERYQRDWLTQLQLVGRLSPDYTAIPRSQPDQVEVTDAVARLDALSKEWGTSGSGKERKSNPLSWYDIPAQWLIMACGLGIGLWIIGVLILARRKTYGWEAATQRLHLPGGASFVPDDIAEVDKRKWHKFYVTINLKPSHPQLGGKGIELDLMRYEPVEEWVLAMEKTAFPELAEEEAEKQAEKQAEANAATTPTTTTTTEPQTP